MENESVSSNIMDIIQRNLKENRAILSQIVKECHDDHRSCITPVTFKRQKPRESRRSLMEFIEIRRNPDRKARSYANVVENTKKIIPLQDRSPLSGVSSNSEEIFQEDPYDDWKPSNNKRMKMSAPLSEVRKAEEVTEEELMRVIIDPRIKKEYRGSQLSTCHQCRQKTQDMKTICRSGICRGVQGQFCGVCLYNRYGENAKEALLDDNWSCPVCRNICNCSFCLPKKGKRCTGILVPVARRHGFTNVHSFLDSLSKNKSEV